MIENWVGLELSYVKYHQYCYLKDNLIFFFVCVCVCVGVCGGCMSPGNFCITKGVRQINTNKQGKSHVVQDIASAGLYVTCSGKTGNKSGETSFSF